MAGTGVIVRGEPVIVAVVAGLRVFGVVELRLGEEVPFADMAGFVAHGFEKLGIGDLAGAQVGGVVAGKVTPDAVAIRGAAGEDGRP